MGAHLDLLSKDMQEPSRNTCREARGGEAAGTPDVRESRFQPLGIKGRIQTLILFLQLYHHLRQEGEERKFTGLQVSASFPTRSPSQSIQSLKGQEETSRQLTALWTDDSGSTKRTRSLPPQGWSVLDSREAGGQAETGERSSLSHCHEQGQRNREELDPSFLVIEQSPFCLKERWGEKQATGSLQTGTGWSCTGPTDQLCAACCDDIPVGTRKSVQTPRY